MAITNIVFQKAERKQAKARIAICAPAGGGKTHSALLIAKGLAPNGKIAVIDTENGSASLEAGKANVPEFDVLTMHAPFDPQKYVAGIQAAEAAGYDVIILDSLTHAWAGTGGLLEKVDLAKKGSKSGNSYTAWADITPQHNKLVEAILQSKAHIIGTMRTKTDYILESNSKGGLQPKKVGMAPIQREGMDYEFTIVFDIDQNSHVATATKDRTSLFDGNPFIPTVETGEQIREWLNDAPTEPEPPVQTPPTPPVENPNPVNPETGIDPTDQAPVAESVTTTEPVPIMQRATIPQLAALRQYAQKSAGVMDDANLIKWLSLMFNVDVAKITELTKDQLDEINTAIAELEGAPNVE